MNAQAKPRKGLTETFPGSSKNQPEVFEISLFEEFRIQNEAVKTHIRFYAFSRTSLGKSGPFGAVNI